ncbi:NXPE family member 3-like isoform X2 [Melanotaenia boesemani]|uniref:NXPE family member 3-like isoform X2 n=1 Tax=Melanotaenia boesemani TaxID=1250792 RepID=UPI001C04185C|nr:NXPE family member 3-like isoform X2 [Melanotaenia boesemani]
MCTTTLHRMIPLLIMRARAYLSVCFRKNVSIFLFLALCIFFFLLYRIEIMEVVTSIKVQHFPNIGWTVSQCQNKVSTSITSTTEPHKNIATCTFQPLSTEEAVEIDSLLDSIAWPETLPLLSSFFLNETSDPAHSSVTILPRRGGGQWHIGDELEVFIKICDFYGRPKTNGGDVLLARLHSPSLLAGVAGQVVDHNNGSYSAVFFLPWEGSALVEVTLVHSSEAVTVLQSLTQEQPDRIYFQSLFRSGSVTETTTCNVCLNAAQQQLCNYTDLHTGDPWFCYKPKTLACDARVTHTYGGFRKTLSPKEEKLFQSDVNMKVVIPASGPANITVLPTLKDQPKMKSSLVTNRPSGFYYMGLWQALDGTIIRQFNTSTAVSQCLKGKTVHLYGDSTIRQWFEYLNNALPDLKEFDLHSLKKNGPFMALDYANNILVTYRCHGPPIRFSTVPVSQLHYVANELDSVDGGTNTVVVIGIWSHFSTYPIEVYIRRLQSIRKAVVRLLSRAPGTRVIIRTANPKALTVYETLTNSDWYSMQRDKVLRAMFEGVEVHLVDAWEMSLAHQLPHSLHPQAPIIKNMIDVLLSHICVGITTVRDPK